MQYMMHPGAPRGTMSGPRAPGCICSHCCLQSQLFAQDVVEGAGRLATCGHGLAAKWSMPCAGVGLPPGTKANVTTQSRERSHQTQKHTRGKRTTDKHTHAHRTNQEPEDIHAEQKYMSRDNADRNNSNHASNTRTNICKSTNIINWSSVSRPDALREDILKRGTNFPLH